MSAALCRCGNPGTTTCDRCGAAVCALCRREDTLGTGICIACRSGAIKLEDFRAEAARRATNRRARNVLRIRKRLVFVPAVVVGTLSLATAVLVPLLADVSGARAERTEHRAREALRAIFEAERTSRKDGKGYASLEDLVSRHLVKPVEIAGYELRVVLLKDGQAFEARAAATESPLRSMSVDARGEVRFEAEVSAK